MGRGIVHPVDVMANEPWSDDLLDYLAADLADHGYDLKTDARPDRRLARLPVAEPSAVGRGGGRQPGLRLPRPDLPAG